MRDLDLLMLPESASVRDAMACIDASGVGIALVATPDRKLLGTVTDGDIRRAMLADVDLDASVRVLLSRQRKLHEPRPLPLTAPTDTSTAELLVLMRRHDVRHIPLVHDDGCVSELAVLDELVEVEAPSLRAVVMAGGYGKRLGQLTAETPKPMLPVGDRPLLERIIEQLREAGIRHVNLTTHYRGDVIAQHFGDGTKFGVELEYVSEEQPLGTAGALGLVESHDPLLIMNGDLLTTVDFRAMHRFHDDHEADMTVAVRRYELRLPYGLVELGDVDVSAVSEKPVVRGFANAGIYLIDPQAAKGLIPAGEPLEMPELIRRLVEHGRRVVAFPLREYWLDIGQIADYEQAARDAAAGAI